MSKLWWLQCNGRRMLRHNKQMDLSRFWVQITESRSPCKLTIAFLFVRAMFHSGDVRCLVRKSQEKWWKCDFCSQNVWGRAPKFLWGIYKSTSLPTYMPSLAEIPWQVFHLCWLIKKCVFMFVILFSCFSWFPSWFSVDCVMHSYVTCSKHRGGIGNLWILCTVSYFFVFRCYNWPHYFIVRNVQTGVYSGRTESTAPVTCLV